MGFATAGTIVSRGLNRAGRDDLSTLGLQKLNTWLASVAKSWKWPMLDRLEEAFPMATPTDAFALSGLPFGRSGTYNHFPSNAGTYPGGGVGVHEVGDKIHIYTEGKLQWFDVPFSKINSNYMDILPAATTGVGTPTRVMGRQIADGVWALHFVPRPDRTYYAVIPYHALPAEVITTDVPWYPDDLTMELAVAMEISSHARGPANPITQAFQQELAAKLSNDRVRHTASDTRNGDIQLDPRVFKRNTSW